MVRASEYTTNYALSNDATLGSCRCCGCRGMLNINVDFRVMFGQFEDSLEGGSRGETIEIVLRTL